MAKKYPRYPRPIVPLNLTEAEKDTRLDTLLRIANFCRVNYEQERRYYRSRGAFGGANPPPRTREVRAMVDDLWEAEKARRSFEEKAGDLEAGESQAAIDALREQAKENVKQNRDRRIARRRKEVYGI